GTRIAATSLKNPAHPDTARLVAEVSSARFGVLAQVRRIGDHQYVGGIFPLTPAPDNPVGGRLLLLADWQPTQQFVDSLRGRFLAGGLVVFGLALIGGVMFSRRVSRPLRDIAAAAADIAGGNLSLQLPVRGSAEDMTVAHAFNEMGASLRAAHARLIHDAIHDPLTLLPNRVLFMERLERAMARRARHPEYRVAVLFIDLDRFKHVNDSLGHTAGDQLLVAFSERLAKVVRYDDTVTRIAAADGGFNTLARFGGDEFVMLIDDIRDPIDAVRVAERVQSISAQSLRLGTQDVFVSPSIGVAVSSPDHRTADEVVRDADLAMYRAKSAGGGRYAVFDAAMHQGALERLRLETELRRAVARQEFRLWYQPIVSLAQRRVVGFEALVRWQHPERGLLEPGAFLRVAEELGILITMDQWALGEACRQGQRWHRAHPDRPPVTVSVNLSAKAFGSDSLVPLVIEVLQATGFPARALRLEITESVAISDADRVRSVLKDLRALGVRVSLDDFGTGYCSLSYLQQFPVDTLKIDRSFVARIGEDEGPGEIIRLIVGLAHTLGLDVVAEGTETAAQVEYLAALGCGFAQGYYFARPMAPEAVPGIVESSLRN
ncbi:MAG: EAL domain-containing protein, partial [Vicinamibacteria bacterium]|nr:EAL domain-containing protein [Vicinamibacteria bacterium]